MGLIYSWGLRSVLSIIFAIVSKLLIGDEVQAASLGLHTSEDDEWSLIKLLRALTHHIDVVAVTSTRPLHAGWAVAHDSHVGNRLGAKLGLSDWPLNSSTILHTILEPYLFNFTLLPRGLPQRIHNRIVIYNFLVFGILAESQEPDVNHGCSL